MHALLRRQLKKLGLDAETVPSETAWKALLDRISATYTQDDQDRYMLERSLAVSSEEMSRLYDELRRSSDEEIARQNARLAESLALATAVQDSVADGIVVVGADDRILRYNAKFLEIWKIPIVAGVPLTTAEVCARTATLLKDPDAVNARIREVTADVDTVALEDVELNDGRILSRYTSPVRVPDGHFRARVWCFRDVTEERRLEAHRAVVAERMSSVGQLVASVAHEINNPLAYVAGNVEVVLSSLKDDTADVPRSSGTADARVDFLEALEDASLGIERIRVIVRDLRALSRIDEDSRELSNVASVMDSAMQMVSNELAHRARVVRDFGETPLVSANPVRLSQVFLNLLVNAMHAIPAGSSGLHTVTVRTSTTAEGFARVEVSDTGKGIAPEDRERIFDPFFTTKPVGSGTGLGLSICKGIVEKLGGTIRVESRVGAGATFAIELPAAAEVPQASVAATGKATSARRNVLVIDDDANVRRWVARALAAHDVVAVSSVDAAIQAVADQPFDAILCDMMMPERTGVDMHTFLQYRHPELLGRVVFMSGGTFTPTLEAFLEQVPNPCLKKPFSVAELESAIASVG